MARREFHFTEGTSNKFWTIELSGKSFTVRFGRIGTDGQTQTKELAGADEAKKAYDKLVAEKIKKGYQEVGAPSAGETTAPAEKPAKGKRAGKEKAPAEPRAKQEEPPEATVLTSAAAVSTDVVRRLHLSPAEVAMKSGEAIQRPAPKPFDREACLQRLGRVAKWGNYYSNYYSGWEWGPAEMPQSMTADEADFWLHALLEERWNNSPRGMVKAMRDYSFKKAPEVVKILKSLTQTILRHWILLPISQLLTAEEIFDWLANEFEAKKKQNHGWDLMGLVNGFASYVRSYLSDKQLKTMRQRVADSLDLNAPWPDHYHPLPFEYYMAAALGMTKKVKQIVARISDTTYSRSGGWSNDYYQQPQFLVLRLGDPAAVESARPSRRPKPPSPCSN